MTRRHEHLDEDDVRLRPGRQKSRARSKLRPSHDDVFEAMVTAVDRGRFTAAPVSDPSHPVHAVKARELGRKGIVVGDRVDVAGDPAEASEDSLVRIVRRHRRGTVLRRSADDTDAVERVVVANADQLAIVTATSEPDPRPRLIDRAVVAAVDGGLSVCLIVTKADLAPPDTLLELYRPLGVPVLARSRHDPLDPVMAQLRGRVTVLLGHSGVGKSTLVNGLVPTALRSTGEVNEVTGRGRHTSSSAVALPLDGGGWVIDTPGVRSFGLGHVDQSELLQAFPDLAQGAQGCPRGCSHDDEHCALDSFVAAGGADPLRLESYRRLLSSRAGGDAG